MMTTDHGSQRKGLRRKRSLTGQFLFSKTSSGLKEDKPVEVPDDFDELVKVFPDIKSQDSFIDQSLDVLKSSPSFGAMVIRIDQLKHKKRDVSQKEYMNHVRLDVADAIGWICRKEKGMWGVIDRDFFGCFFPEKDKSACVKLAEKCKTKLSQKRDETVTIGIAAYPTLSFKKHQILENARKAFDHALFFGPNSTVSFDAVSLNISGDKLYDTGDIKGAIKEFNKALLLDPSNVNVHNSLGVCHGMLGHYKKALKEFKSAILLDPKDIMALHNAGLTCKITGDKTKAFEYFLRADRLDKDVFEVAFQTGRLYVEEKQPDNGLEYLEKAIKLKPESASAFSSLGECYASLDMIDQAFSAYKKAIKLNANDADSLSALGVLFDAQGENLDISTLFCRQSVEISPENGLFRYRLGKLYQKANKIEAALKEFEAAKKLGYDAMQEIKQIQNIENTGTS
ncbi:MAG: tetratricopeptide repeat protein [Thermodesulfobacteriota bacterium]|nr:tetratricopeptide repeat protein [Thermodesulfobacteriota bacterium]